MTGAAAAERSQQTKPLLSKPASTLSLGADQDDPLPPTRLARCSSHFAQMRLANPLVFPKANPVYQTPDFGYLAWHLGPEGGDPVASGFDVAIVRNDIIAELYTVITK